MNTNAMKVVNIASQQLPGIERPIKECINSGQWLLFKSPTASQQNCAYILKVGAEFFALDDSGCLIRKLNGLSGGVRIDELFYFSDLPRPESLSNIAA